MSASSTSYWNATERIRDDLNDIASMGVEMYAALESNDDPGDVVDHLVALQTKLNAVTDRVTSTIPAMQGIGKAFDEMASIKS